MATVSAPAATTPDGTLVLDRPVTLPDVLDAIIVGGGPFGTAAAFRMKELGLSALVIDYDDLMKRIRDYAKDKQILPDYGGGDRMQFPRGGDAIRSLQFPAIDKDRMCEYWKSLYRTHCVPAQIGVEFTGLEPADGIWQVLTWNHNTKSEQVFRARHVVMAFGRGVPRRLDIPGDVEGIAFGLTTAERYVGEPAIVIGGGTSAGEAVIAISNAKAAASDSSGVYWSYRGAKMPKVSKALADVFFDAFVGNGNVRYLPESEPTAVVEVGDHSYLSLRTSRVSAEGRPIETTQLEFRKPFCIACIGEDIPEALLAKIGTPLVTGGPTNKKRIVISPLLETQQPNVYLAGDVLSPAYFETPDFDADPAGFKEVKRRGNIKAAMRDGVFVAEVIAQKIAGRTLIEVNLEFEQEPQDAEPAPAAASDVPASPVPPAAPSPVPTPVAAAPSGPPKPPEQPLKRPREKPQEPSREAPDAQIGRLVSILPTGVEANEYPLNASGATRVGRQGADIVFPQDGLLSDIHATVEGGPDGYRVRDEGSAQGVFVQLAATHTAPIAPGTILRGGRQWVVVGEGRSPARLVHYSSKGEVLRRFELRRGTTIVGRQSPDITLDLDDASLSRRHFAIELTDDRLTVRDLGSSNGTFVKVDKPFLLAHGDRVHVGQQVLQFVNERVLSQPESSVAFDTSYFARQPVQATPPASSQPTPAAPPSAGTPPRDAADKQRRAAAAPPLEPVADGSPAIFFEGLQRRVTCTKGQTICEAAEAAGIKLDADCHQGSCGMDPVKVLSGAEHLNSPGSVEKSTLEDLCSLEPGPYRLACMARVSGPVAVNIVKQ